MSQVKFFLSTDEVRAIILQLMDTNEVEIFNGAFFEKEYLDSIKNIDDLSDSKNLIFWLKNEFTRPRCSSSGGGMMKGKFLFDYYKDPIIEFDNCIWTQK